MARRGPRQAALRWHQQKGWYFLYDGKPKYFGGAGPRETSQQRRRNPAIRAAAEAKWHLLETTRNGLTPLGPALDAEEARAELRSLSVAADEITDAVIQEWRQLSIRSDREEQITFLMRLGVDEDLLLERPGLMETLRGGAKINREFAAMSKTHEQIALATLLAPLTRETPEEWLKRRRLVDAPTCKQITDTYLAYLKKQPKGQRHYIDATNRLKRWLKFIGAETPAAALTRADFVRYRDKLVVELTKREKWEATQPKPIPLALKRQAPGIAPSTFNKFMVLVKGAFHRWSEETDQTIDDQDRCLSVLAQVVAEKRELPLFTPADIQQIVAESDLKWRCIVLIALNCALTNTDVAFLNWNMIRWEQSVLDYWRDKNQQTRRLPLWGRTIMALNEWRQVCPSQHLVFTTVHGQPFISVGKKGKSVKDSLGQQFGNRMRARKMPYVFGTFRKSATTVAAMHGANELAIKMLLGDAPNETWRSYGQAVPEIVANAVESIETYYFGKEKARAATGADL